MLRVSSITQLAHWQKLAPNDLIYGTTVRLFPSFKEPRSTVPAVTDFLAQILERINNTCNGSALNFKSHMARLWLCPMRGICAWLRHYLRLMQSFYCDPIMWCITLYSSSGIRFTPDHCAFWASGQSGLNWDSTPLTRNTPFPIWSEHHCLQDHQSTKI
jgi:hypothetical protein